MNFPPFQTHRPLQFSLDLETGLMQMSVVAKMNSPVSGEFDVVLTVFSGTGNITSASSPIAGD